MYIEYMIFDYKLNVYSIECIYMELQEGQYHVISPGTQETCGFYVSSEPEKQIVISFDYVDVSCLDGGLISVGILKFNWF